jgi:hypothetical protein
MVTIHSIYIVFSLYYIKSKFVTIFGRCPQNSETSERIMLAEEHVHKRLLPCSVHVYI